MLAIAVLCGFAALGSACADVDHGGQTGGSFGQVVDLIEYSSSTTSPALSTTGDLESSTSSLDPTWSSGASTSTTSAETSGPGHIESESAETGVTTDSGTSASDSTADSGDESTGLVANVDPQTEMAAEAVAAAIAEAHAVDTDEFLSNAKVTHLDQLGYDPLEAAHLELIDRSPFKLTDREQAVLGRNGFVVSGNREFISFTHGYSDIYSADLPVYISADSILYAMHRSFDDIVKTFELELLEPILLNLIRSARDRLADLDVPGLHSPAIADVDLVLSVADSILQEYPLRPVAGADHQQVKDILAAISSEKFETIELFGKRRMVDFSQFRPRGHYVDEERLVRYFQALIWLGRIDLRMLEPDELGQLQFDRRQFESVIVFNLLFTGDRFDAWRRINDTLDRFVGPADYMTLADRPRLMAAAEVIDPTDLLTWPEQKLADLLLGEQLGTQKILSHAMLNPGGETLPLSSSFALLGQRYVVDSEVLSNVVYDRTSARRMMPSPLDIAYAALANDHAATLLKNELETYHYAGNLGAMRVLVDANDDSFWQENLYNLWTSALRSLSVQGDASQPGNAGRPQVTGTEAWSRRLLSTQLASWAELRHDTLLCAKQSFTTGSGCAYPDAYVDPYPEFFQAVIRYAESGIRLLEQLGLPADTAWVVGIASHYQELAHVAAMLHSITEVQRTGASLSTEQLSFVEGAVWLGGHCGGPSGWYSRLFFDPESELEFDPTIADVHTQPYDEGGNVVGRVLHVATGGPQAMVVTVDSCTGPRAYVGVVSAYHEMISQNFDRWTDARWAEFLTNGGGETPPWLTDIVTE